MIEYTDTGPSEEDACRDLWQHVILQALMDATHPNKDSTNPDDRRARREAPAWISDCGKNFRMVCDLAGWDADFISEAFRDGRIRYESLKRADAPLAAE